jgi:hypothetical protein
MALLVASALTASAQAQDAAIATAPAGNGAPTASQEATNKQIEDYLNQRDPAPAILVPEKRAIHGEVGAAMGTGGYRSAYAVTVIPIGETGELGIAVGESRFSGRKGWGGGSQKSLSVSLNLDKPLVGPASTDCMPRTGVRLPSDDARTGCRQLEPAAE